MLRCLIAFCVAFSAIASAPAMAQTLPDKDRWIRHVTDEMLPFWTHPDALGDPVGQFPGLRCNDGTLPTPGVDCQGAGALAEPAPQTLVSLSRQIYSYGVAFHMTGESRYLDLARAGLDHQFASFLNADTGLFHEHLRQDTGATSPTDPAALNSQKQAYGLLGPSFIYYLTRDPALFEQIKGVKTALDATFRDADTGAYAQFAGQTGPSVRIQNHLDQLNSYQYLLAANAPSSVKEQWVAEARQTAHYIKDRFFSEDTGLFRTIASEPATSLKSVDFGHSAKTLWFMDLIGTQAGDPTLVNFARAKAPGLFDQALKRPAGAWMTGYDRDGALVEDPAWWIYNELNQYAGSLAVGSPEYRSYLELTQPFWLEHFVDETHGGIWSSVDIETGAPFAEHAKHWEWKAGFHAFEHALVSYLSAAGIEGTGATLYFSRIDGLDDFGMAYTFLADGVLGRSVSPAGSGVTGPVQTVQFSNIRLGAAVVPLPASALLLLAGIGGFALLRRR